MRTALGCPEALGLWGCPMYRYGGRGAAALRFLRRVWCTQKALTNEWAVNQGVKALGAGAVCTRTIFVATGALILVAKAPLGAETQRGSSE